MSSNDAKKPASRDISDLKARLGLKKGGAAPGAAPGAPFPAPPGSRSGQQSAVPAPPGAARPSAPMHAPVPDARQDPFAAMNAMTQQQVHVAAAPIVIIDDGKGEKLHGKKSNSWILMSVVGVVVISLGYFMGGISYKNGEYNDTIDAAKTLTSEIKETGKPLQTLFDALLVARERGGNQNSFIANDPKLVAELEALELKKPNREGLLQSRLINMDPGLVEDTLMFYSDLVSLYDQVSRHIRMSKAGLKALEGKDASKKFGAGIAFGVIFDQPRGGEKSATTAQVVQLGPPVCADGKPNPEGCGAEAPTGFQYRPDVTQPAWGSKKWSSDTVTADQVYWISPTTVWTALVAGSDRFYSEISYMDRLTQIEEMTKALTERRKSLENRMNQKAQESKSFAL